MRKERGEIDNHLPAECNGSGRPWHFHASAVLPTAIAGMLVLAIHGLSGVGLQRALYIVILSSLLQYHHLDHLQIRKLGPAERLPTARVGAA